MRKLNDKQKLFCKEYIISLNASEAYTKAYSTQLKKVKNNTARARGAKLLTKDNILVEIKELKEERNERLKIDSDWVLVQAQELLKMAKGEKPHIHSTLVAAHWVDISRVSQLAQDLIHEQIEPTDSRKWQEQTLAGELLIRSRIDSGGEVEVQLWKPSEWKKSEVFKTNIKEAINALNTIGKHTKVKAFDSEVEISDNTIYVVGAPKK